MIERINDDAFLLFANKYICNSFSIAKNTQYFGYFVDSKLVAVSGILWYKNKAVFKNAYVLPLYRGNGYYKEMVNYRLALVKAKGVIIVEVTCNKYSQKIYTGLGFKITNIYKTLKKLKIIQNDTQNNIQP